MLTVALIMGLALAAVYGTFFLLDGMHPIASLIAAPILGALGAGVFYVILLPALLRGIDSIHVPQLPPAARAGLIGCLALAVVAAYATRRMRLYRVVNRHVDQLAPVLVEICDHIGRHYPSEGTSPSAVVDRHLEAAVGARWWQSKRALLELRHGAVKATEAVRVVLRKVPQDDELRVKLTTLVSVRGEILSAVHKHLPPNRLPRAAR